MSNLEILSESALDGLRLQTLVLVANKLHYIEVHAFRYVYRLAHYLSIHYKKFEMVTVDTLTTDLVSFQFHGCYTCLFRSRIQRIH